MKSVLLERFRAVKTWVARNLPRPDANATRVACVEQAYVCLRTTTKQSARASVLRFREYCLKYALNITVHGLLRHAVPW